MQTDKIINGIKNSPLTDQVKKESIDKINECSKDLEKMFHGQHYKAPSAQQEFYKEITAQAMSVIPPIMREASVSEINGTNTYAHIHASISGENPEQYLE